MTSERVEELRNRADLIMAWEAFEPGMEAPAPLDYEDTACKLMEAAAYIDRLRGALWIAAERLEARGHNFGAADARRAASGEDKP